MVSNPTEILYWEILPAIRRTLVIELLSLDLKKSEVAKLLDVTPSAISQYIKNKRGNELEFDSKFEEEIKNSANRIKFDKKVTFDEVNKLIKIFQNSKHLCKICVTRNTDRDDSCNICIDK